MRVRTGWRVRIPRQRGVTRRDQARLIQILRAGAGLRKLPSHRTLRCTTPQTSVPAVIVAGTFLPPGAAASPLARRAAFGQLLCPVLAGRRTGLIQLSRHHVQPPVQRVGLSMKERMVNGFWGQNRGQP